MSDVSEIDALDALEVSDGWLLVAGRVREEIERRRDALEAGEFRDGENRGFIAACRMVLGLPESMANEFKQQEDK